MTKVFDQRTGLQALSKRSAEDRVYYVDFVNLIASGDSLSAVGSVASTNQSLVTGSSNVTLGTTTISDTSIKIAGIAGGTAYEDYVLKASATTTNGETLETEVLLRVRD